MQHKTAYTIAETLITIGIIGVIASMTIPNLISSHQKQVTVNKLKAAYQMFSEIMELAKLQTGFESILLPHETLTKVGNAPEISELYLEPYIKGAEKYKGKYIQIKTPSKSNFLIEYKAWPHEQAPTCMPNEFCFWFFHHENNYTYFIVDINGPKGPNTAGKDVFMFDISGKYKPGIGIKDIDSIKLFSNDINEFCNKTSSSIWNGKTCASKIISDGWQIKDDYPW